MMRAPENFQPQLVNTSSMPYAAAPAWLRSQRYPGEQTFAQADQHAMQVAQEQHDSFKDLLFHLVYTERWSDVEAARVLFRWMTSKHMYSIEFAGAPPGSPEELMMGFRDNKSTYCRIFELLCLYSGIPCITVVGYAKGIEVRPGSSLQDLKFNHSWNVIFVDDAWQLVDCHWATRYLQSNDSNVPENMVYEYDDFYFCPDPEALVYSHFPEDPKWQLLRQPLSMYDFEDLPVAKSAFFKNDLKFLSHHSGVIPSQKGCINLSLGNYNPLSFTFKLLYGESCKDELGGVKLTRYGIQETKDGQVNLFVRAPVKGFYYLTVYSTQIKRRFQDESIYNAVCEYKIICDVPYPNADPYPFVSDTNWGPGADVYQAGLIPNNRNAVIVAHDGHIELDFEKVKPMRVLPKLTSAYANEKQCEQAIKQDDNEYISRVDIDLPANGEYALEIYANDPARDGNTYTHVCQYLLVKPNKGDNAANLFYQTPNYQECYNVHGMKEPYLHSNMSLEQLARGMNDVRLTDAMLAEPRPSVKQAAMTGVEIEQVTVSPKPKPGIAPKPKGDKPGKPAPKPKPKPVSGVAGRAADALPHANEDYANLPLSGGQVGVQGPFPGDEYNTSPGAQATAGYGTRGPHDGYQQPVEYLDQQAQNATSSQQGVPAGKYSDVGYGAKPYKGPGPDGYDGQDQDSQGRFVSELAMPGYGQKGDPRYGKEGEMGYVAGDPRYGQEGDPRYGVGDPRYGQEGDPRYGKEGDPRYGQEGDPRYGKEGDPRYGQEGDPRYGQEGDPRYGQEGDPRYGQEGDPRYGKEGDPRYGQEGDPRYGQEGDPRYGQEGDPRYGQEGDPRYGQKGEMSYGPGDPRYGQEDSRYGRKEDLGYPGMGGPAYAGREGYDEYGRPLAGYGQSQDDMEKHGRQRSADDDVMGSGQYGGRGADGRGYSQSGVSDEDFPAPPPASDMLNMEFAPERRREEVPIAPTTFEPIHIARLDGNSREVDTQLSNVPKPMPPQLEENLVFSAERAQQFKTVDTHAVQVAKTEHNSFRDLIWDLIYDKNITDDLEKARVIFLWLCTKDLGSMQFRNVKPGSPEEILLNVKQGKASYAQIYETLCSYAGLHCRVIRGYAKGADYKPGMRFRGTQAFHAWNSVLIHGHWRLIDCHWASRRMFGKKGTEHIRYELDDYYFCVDPRQLIYTHFPEDKQWQLLEQPYELDEFEDLPLVKSLFFRYCLQLESHTYATVVADAEFKVTVNYQYYRGPGLEFTFSLHTDEGEEAVSGVALSRFGVQETTNDGKANFRIRPPAVGVYKLAIYAKEVQVGEKVNRMYCAVVEYRLEVGSVPPDLVPYPPCSGTTWGISPATAKKNGLSTKFTSGVMYTKSGQSEIRFKLHRQLLFSGKLRSNAYSEEDLKSCILYRTVGETAIFSVSVPAPGEYGLEVFVNDPTIDGKSLRHMCQYLLICGEPQDLVSGIRFPQLPPAYLGPQQAYTRLGMNTVSNKDPLIHCTSGAIEVSFSTTTPLRATSNLILTAGNQDLTEYILQQFRDSTLSFQIRLPRAGIYKFQIFAQPLDDSSDSLPGVYNYLINCSSVPSPPLPFPKQFSQWKEGCFLLTPVDGDLAAAQTAQDPRPNYIFYQVSVPNASRVAVVVGTEWTHLEVNAEGIWEGAAFFQAGWGQENTAALTANYGSNSASYNTLLEFRM